MKNDATSLAGNAPHPDFFIVGFSRSGTTLLASLLNRHSGLCVPPETRFCDGVMPYGRLDSTKRDHDFLTDRVFSYWRTPDLGISRPAFEREFRMGEATYGNAFACLLNIYRKNAGKPQIGEKSPVHLLHVHTILSWFPDARIFCAIRDGRDVVESISTAAFSHNNRVRHAAEWAWQMRLAMRLAEEFPASFRLIRFEDLLLQSEAVLQGICAEIGVDFEDRLLDPAKSSDVVPEWEAGWKSDALATINKEKVAQWKSRPLRPWTDALLTEIIGRELAALGFDATKPATAPIRSGAWIASLPFTGVAYAALRKLSVWLKEFLYRTHIRRVW